VGGEEWSQSVSTNVIEGEPWLEVVNKHYISTQFECSVCGLKLDTREQLAHAHIPETFIETEVREPDYGPDYGND
jgi:hypothetical protein